MRLKILIFALVISNALFAQSFFKPLAKPGTKISLKTGSTLVTVQNSFRPIVGVTASISDGTNLAGGIGASFQHNIWDTPSQTWITQYSVSALVFLDTRAAVVGGLVLGLANGLIQIGPGWDFTTKKFTLLTGVGIKFN